MSRIIFLSCVTCLVNKLVQYDIRLKNRLIKLWITSWATWLWSGFLLSALFLCPFVSMSLYLSVSLSLPSMSPKPNLTLNIPACWPARPRTPLYLSHPFPRSLSFQIRNSLLLRLIFGWTKSLFNKLVGLPGFAFYISISPLYLSFYQYQYPNQKINSYHYFKILIQLLIIKYNKNKLNFQLNLLINNTKNWHMDEHSYQNFSQNQYQNQ